MRLLFVLFTVLLAGSALAEMAPRPGWAMIPTQKDPARLLADLKTAVQAEGMVVVTQAGPTAAAKARGITIPENRVIGVFNNDFAVRTLALSTAAMIEAPIRFYITETPDGSATLSYKTPGFVFEPYRAEAGPELDTIAADLDGIFARIAARATR